MKENVAACWLDWRKKCLHPEKAVECIDGKFLGCGRLKWHKRKNRIIPAFYPTFFYDC